MQLSNVDTAETLIMKMHNRTAIKRNLRSIDHITYISTKFPIRCYSTNAEGKHLKHFKFSHFKRNRSM